MIARMRLPMLAAAIVLTACSSSSGKGPVLAPSAEQTSYALHYPDELSAATKGVGEAQSRDKALGPALSGRVDELKKPDWQKVLAVIDASDEAGKSAAFADERIDSDAVRTFWETEKDVIAPRVSANAQHALKDAGCGADVSGHVTYALNDAMNKQLQKRLRARNEAFVVLERYKTQLGPQNVATLEKLADEISQASYDVHVLMVVERERLQRLIGDKDTVKKTLDRFVQDETAYQSERGRTDAEKKASSDRVLAANKAKAEIDSAVSQAESVSKQMDAALESATKDYGEALRALRAKVGERQKAEGAPKAS